MIILLTGCINPKGMIMTALTNHKEREIQYIKAIEFYLTSTNYPIVFTENSGTDISSHFLDAIKSRRLECLTFQGNLDKKRGKGYGECEIIEYALQKSQLIRFSHDKRIAKITGRLIVRNISTIIRLHYLLLPKQATICAYNSDLSFPDSRFIIATVDFYRTFLRRKESINDTIGYYFEHALSDTIKKETRHFYYPFFLMPRIEGISGSTGKNYSIIPNSFAFIIKYAKYAIKLKIRFNKLIQNNDFA